MALQQIMIEIPEKVLLAELDDLENAHGQSHQQHIC